MFRPLFFAPLAIALVVLQQIPTTSGTVAITIGALALTATQTTALASVAALGIGAKLAGIGIGAGVAGLGAALLSGSSRRSSRRRGKRYAEEEEDLSLETFANLEVEDCYKRVICAASTGEVENPQVQNVLALFNPVQFMQAPLSQKAMKFVEAARYGQVRRSVAKCEHRYTCSLGMDILQDLF